MRARDRLAAGCPSRRFVALGCASLLALAARAALAESPAMSACPTQFFLTGNLAVNSNFESPSPGIPVGQQTCWRPGLPVPPPSAAGGWFMHSSNQGDRVCSQLLASTAPEPNGTNMLRFTAGGNEGGIYQTVTAPVNSTYMFSVWVYVLSGQVAIQSSANVGGPVAWSTKIGQWEQLRVCNNTLWPADSILVYNQDPNGGSFYVDRVELREIPNVD
jgi:hypothetical protein